MVDLRTASIPEPMPDDHRRGGPGGPVLVEYGDLECSHCAVLHARLRTIAAERPFILVFRHFPVRSAHPRAWAAACAAEAAALQGRFWEMHDAILEDQGHMEDPHLWSIARSLGLDVERFDVERRSDPVQARVRRDFDGGVRGGVVSTPTVFFEEGVARTGAHLEELLVELSGGGGSGIASQRP